MNESQYRKTWLKLQKSYEKKAFTIFRNGIRNAAKNIPFDKLDKYNYIASIMFHVNEKDIFKAYYKTYYTIGLLYGNRVTRGIVRDTKSVEVDVFQQAFKDSLQQWITENIGSRIVTVRESLIKYLLAEINKGIEEGYDIQEIAKNIEKLVNSRNFYRWQALRIARTETTTAANYAASVSSRESIYVLDKVWISAHDSRVRRRPKSKFDHVHLNGVKVDEKGVFIDNGVEMLYPGDPSAPSGAIIGCRCSVALTPRRDSNGRLVRK